MCNVMSDYIFFFLSFLGGEDPIQPHDSFLIFSLRLSFLVACNQINH